MTSSNGAGLFVNDGSFLERFKQMQGNPDAMKATSVSDGQASTGTSDNHQDSFWVKTPASLQESPVSKTGNHKPAAPTNGKLAFSLKQKSRLAVNPLKLGGEDEEDGEDGQDDNDRRSKKLKSDKASGFAGSISEQGSPAPPADPEVKKVIDKLATFVAKNGRQFENITRQKNPGDSPFRFLFDVSCPEYKYYEQQLGLEEQSLLPKDDSGGGSTAFRNQGIQQRYSSQQHANYSIPSSALYSGSTDEGRKQHREPVHDNVRQAKLQTDSVSMMEFYMKKAAQEDLRKPLKQSKDELPPPVLPPLPVEVQEEVPDEPSVNVSPTTAIAVDAAQALGKKGHHMGDYIPPEELEKFLAKCNDAMARKAAKATADRAKIQADNVGHRLLSKMGWKEGEGLGSRKGGRADPVQAGSVKLNNLGVGAEQPGEVTPDDDIYEQYKKRMMLGYRFRPNPLNNPRKAYY